jgi:hypothetical protein
MIEDINESNVLELIESASSGMHRTIRGKYVKIGSQACKNDIEARIEDITHNRNNSGHGSDARSYYSGVLRVLRRKLRETDRILSSKNETKIKKIAEHFDYFSEMEGSRILTLSGIF